MKLAQIATWVSTAAVIGTISLAGQPVEAFQLKGGSTWTYSHDAKLDGSEVSNGRTVPGSKYDIGGIAISQQGEKLVVAITSNIPLGGYNNSPIAWGDFFINTTGKNFPAAQGQLFAIRFDAKNDTTVGGLGVYAGVTSKSVTSKNQGWSNMKKYYNHDVNGQNNVFDVANTMGNNGLATKAEVYNYFNEDQGAPTTIASGQRIGDIELLSGTQLAGYGLNFGTSQGSQTFGFSFDRNLLPNEDFMANVFPECGNDGVAIGGEAVPEPMTMAGTALGLVAIGAVKRKRQQRKQDA